MMPYTRKYKTKLHTLIPKLECNICGITKEKAKELKIRLVWDHNHTTNIIRGVLCEICNVWLVNFEKQKLCKFIDPVKVFGPRKALWMKMYNDKIEEHLKSTTGIYYSNKDKWVKAHA